MKDKSDDARCLQLEDSDSLNTELSKLKIENESLRSKYNELTSENNRLNPVMSSWTKSSISLGKVNEVQKPFNYRFGLGFISVEISSSDTSTQSYLTDDNEAVPSIRPPCATSSREARQARCYRARTCARGGAPPRMPRSKSPRPEGRLLRQPALEGLTRSARTDSPRKVCRNKFWRGPAAAWRPTAAAAASEEGEVAE
ncbi:hypothetical protein F511_07873 [Dorcoceras hygrometricum]|uniref:Uncharacterized protein n=1 Tax=Dorcoceras hygrometricum TaxID=472368 RepID=A0A2Z7CQI9_9LAMI|nr:hypothetical protein F511_07873 [Dorcoceras hygrometricum]